MWRATRQPECPQAPQRCAVCGSDFVHPVEWHEVDESHMWARLRCGQCETWRDDVFADDVLDGYERKLDRDAGEIAAAAERLHAEWRTIEADAFAAALDRGLIDAADFAR